MILQLNAETSLVRLSGNTQGTTYHIAYYDSLNRNLQFKVDSILKDFDLSVSTYNQYSLISQFNRSSHGVKMDKYFKSCMIQALEIWKSTNGAFDPSVYPLVNAYGFGPGKKQSMTQKMIDSLLCFVGLDKLSIQGDSIIKSDPRLGLDFNAFAQGYSVDVISDFIRSQGILSYIVEIGGEVYANDLKPNAQFWTVGIEMPFDNKDSINPLRAIAKLKNMALSTSGNYRRYYYENGNKVVHHIDPRTGYPTSNNLLSASVFSRTCIKTDASATGLLVLGLEEAVKYLAQHREIEAYLIYSDENGLLKVYKTIGLNSIVSDL